MPVNTPEFGAERGQAGETGFSKSKKYNFANLYSMNRSDQQLQEKVDEFQKGANSVNAQMANQVNKAKAMSNNAGQPVQGQSPVNQSEINYAMNQAKGISNAAQNFSIENEAIKNNLSPYQSAMAGFYSGVSNPYINQIRAFQNVYNKALGQDSKIKEYMAARDLQAKAIPKPPGKPKKPGPYDDNFLTQDEADELNQQRPSGGNMHDTRNIMSTLVWGFKTGKITDEEYEAAIKGGPGSPAYEAAKAKLKQY
jgi:hypothetical protein